LYNVPKKGPKTEDAIRQIRNLLEDGMFQSGSKFPITGKHKYINLHQQYNAFILRQDGDLDGMGISGWMFSINYSKYSKNVSTSYSSMRRVYRASEELVLEVARGEF
jgi:hypothetical protein